MIELFAVEYSDPGRSASRLRGGWSDRVGSSREKGHEWTFCHENVFLAIRADRPVEGSFYDSGRIALICHADLLGTDSGEDAVQANTEPAASIARLYERHGDLFARGLHGWFGIVLYDRELKTLKAWTDHFGIRRLVFHAAADYVALASDLRLLSAFADSRPEIDPVAILEYMQYSCIPAPRTIFKGMQRLEPGYALRTRPRVFTQQYWRVQYQELHGQSEGAWAAETYESIKSAVALAVKPAADINRLGCFLSGGTDSSSVSGLVGRITGRPPRTFSIGFDDPRYNEIEYARIAARHFQADHHEYFVTPQDIVDLLQKARAVYDEPFGNSSIIPAYFCARVGVENGLTHMLAGDGGDELFGGNQRYADDRVFQRYAMLPRWLRHGLVDPASRLLPAGAKVPLLSRASSYVRRANIPIPDRWHSYEFLSSTPASEIFLPEFLHSVSGHSPLEPSRRHFRDAAANDDLNRWLYLDLRITLNDNDLRKVTSMCELAGITPRYPLLDPVLAQYSGTVPADLKVRGMHLRYLFKKAMRDLLPLEIIRKSKHGFGLPYSVWVGTHGPLKELTFDILGSRACSQRGYFRPDLLSHVWSRYETVHRNFYGTALWLLLMLELWHDNQDSSAGRAAAVSGSVQG